MYYTTQPSISTVIYFFHQILSQVVSILVLIALISIYVWFQGNHRVSLHSFFLFRHQSICTSPRCFLQLQHMIFTVYWQPSHINSPNPQCPSGSSPGKVEIKTGLDMQLVIFCVVLQYVFRYITILVLYCPVTFQFYHKLEKGCPL